MSGDDVCTTMMMTGTMTMNGVGRCARWCRYVYRRDSDSCTMYGRCLYDDDDRRTSTVMMTDDDDDDVYGTVCRCTTMSMFQARR